MEIATSRVLLTGASGGIGKQIATSLLESGGSLLLHCRSANQLTDFLALHSLPESRLSLVEGDLNDRADLDKIVTAAGKFKVNTLINNAGVNSFEAFEESDIKHIVSTNVIASMKLTQMVLPYFHNLPEAIIFNIGSTFGSIGFAGYVAYSATKHAVKGFSEALRRELANTNIKVLYISPRATATKMNGSHVNEANLELKVKTDSPELVATEVVNSLRKELLTKQLGWPEKILVILNAIFPGIVDAALEKKLPIIKRHILRRSKGRSSGRQKTDQ